MKRIKMYFILFKNWYKAELETILNRLNADWLFLLIFLFLYFGTRYCAV